MAATNYGITSPSVRSQLCQYMEGPDEFPQHHSSQEDLMIVRSFRHLGEDPNDTQDEMGEERFVFTTPGHNHDSKFPKTYHKQSIDIRHGVDHCSKKKISFQYVPVALMYRLGSTHFCTQIVNICVDVVSAQ